MTPTVGQCAVKSENIERTLPEAMVVIGFDEAQKAGCYEVDAGRVQATNCSATI